MNAEIIDDWIGKNRDDILTTLSELIRIKTINSPPDGGEKPGQEYLYNKISKFIPEKSIDLFDVIDVEGIHENNFFEPLIDGVERNYKNRPNLVARLEGDGSGRSIVFSGHMDTVGVREKEWKVFKDPFSGNIRDGKMYGRGILDMKAGLLAGFFALKCLSDLKIKLKGDVIAESVVDEELGGMNGTIACRLKYPDIDFAILPEPTDLTLGIENRSGSVWKATVREKGPGGYSQDINPINKLSEFSNLLEEYDSYRNKKMVFPEKYNGVKFHKLLIFLIYSGGKNYIENASYVPMDGQLYFYIPTRPYTKEEELWSEFSNFLNEKAANSKYLKDGLPEFERTLRYFNGNITDTEHPAFYYLKQAYKKCDLKYEEKACPFFCDAEAFKLVGGTEVVLIGPKGDRLHGMDEYVEIESIFDLIKILIHTAIGFCS